MKVTTTGWVGKGIDIKDTLIYNDLDLGFLELNHVFPRKGKPINWGPLWPPRKVKITVEEVTPSCKSASKRARP